MKARAALFVWRDMQPALMTEQDVANAAKRLPFMQFPERGLCAGAILARLRAWASVGRTPANIVQIRTAALKAQQEHREWQQRQEKSRNWTETSGEPSTPPGSETAEPYQFDRLGEFGGQSYHCPDYRTVERPDFYVHAEAGPTVFDEEQPGGPVEHGFAEKVAQSGFLRVRRVGPRRNARLKISVVPLPRERT